LKRSSRLTLAAGLSIALVGATADFTGISSRPGLGALQLAMIAVGLVVAAWGAFESRPRARRNLARMMLIAISSYLALWILEVMIAYPLNPRLGKRSPMRSMPGLYEKGELVSYRHAPGFQGTFDDGILQVSVAINSKGDRDDEPREDVDRDRKLMLIGDSFTFGHALEIEESIAGRIEARAEGEIDAYNLGVMGYGPGDTALRLEEAAWWQGRTVYYLFFPNDLQNNNARPGLITVYQGWGVPVFGPDGHEYRESEWDALIAYVLEHGTAPDKTVLFSNTFTLRHLRGMVEVMGDRDLRLSGFPEQTYAPENISAAIQYTARMHELASERGASFEVVILPARGEAEADEYSSWTQRYIDGIEANGEQTIELLDRLDGEDYFRHDPHFNAAGADATAAAIVEHFDQ